MELINKNHSYKMGNFPFDNQHIKFGFSSKNNLVFEVEIGENSRAPCSIPFNEAVLAAKKISEQAGSCEINLLLSGGTDSHCMCLAFRSAGIDFMAIIIRMEDGLNDHDIHLAIEFCKTEKIKYKIIQLDPYRFFESSEFEYYVYKYRCSSPQIAFHLFALDHILGVPILAGNPILPGLSNSGEIQFYPPLEPEFSLVRYFISNNRKGVSHFFLYSPELVYSFLELDFYKNSIATLDAASIKSNPLQFSHTFKSSIYQASGFEFKSRQCKFTGFEKLKEVYHKNYVGGFSEPVFDNLNRYLNFQFFPAPTTYVLKTNFLNLKA